MTNRKGAIGMHVEKLTLSEARAIISHDLRKNKTYSNKNIDTEKKDQNIVFNKRGYDYIKNYIQRNGIKVHGANGKAKDGINYAVSVVLHYPEDCTIPEKDFFKMAHIILGKKFGKDNIICSVVHRDEMRSHLHFVFMPIVKDKKGRKKLCCKEVVSREMLKALHSDVEKAFKSDYNLDVKLQNEEKGQFKNIAHIEDYKKYKDLQKNVDSLNIQKDDIIIDNILLQNEVDSLKQEIKQLKDEAEQARRYYNDKKLSLQEVKEDIDKNCNQAIEDYKKQRNEDLKKECNRIDSEFDRLSAEYKKQANEDLQKACEKIDQQFKKQLKELGLSGHDVVNINDFVR